MMSLSRRDFLKASAAGLAAMALPSIITKNTMAAGADQTPNIVLIYADDIGYGDIGCYGATSVKTPNVDRLAKEGIRFTSGYASSATCTPSRYSMLTGQYAWRKKGTGVLRGDAPMIISTKQATLPSVLKRAGYTTGVVGKWHLGLGDGNVDWNKDIKPGPMEIGFDYSFLMPATGDRVPCVYMEGHRVINLDTSDPITVSYKGNIEGEPTGKTHRDSLKMDWGQGHNGSIVNGISRIGHMKGGKSALWTDEDMADVFVKNGKAFIERNKKKPFFLYFSTHDIHVPRVPHSRFVGKTTMGPRGDAIAQFDWCVGQIIEKLQEQGLTKNTIVILASDNGPVLNDGYKDQAVEKVGDHKAAGPLRGGKYSFYEGGTRTPFIVRWPGTVKPGVSDAIVSQVDFIGSFAAFTGQKLADNEAPDSFNVMPALLGKSKRGRDYVIEHARGLAVRTEKWKYIEPGGKKAKPQLYHLVNDKGEAKEVSQQNPEKLKEMQQMLAKVKNTAKSRP